MTLRTTLATASLLTCLALPAVVLAQANEARMQRELDQMRADLDALKQELATGRNGDPNVSAR